MTNEIGNTCARCSVPIKSNMTLCKVCSDENTARTTMVPCRACGSANPSDIEQCAECGAPIMDASTIKMSTVTKHNDEASDQSEPGSMTVIGRRAELKVIEDCVNLCIEKNRVGGVIISGEAGMGVSTLLGVFARELAQNISSERIHFIQCREGGEAFSSFRAILRQRFEISDGADPLTMRLQFTNQIGRLLGMVSAALVTETAHLLGYLAGISYPKSPVLKAIESDQTLMRQQLEEAICRFLKADSQAGPTVIIFDDMQKTSADEQKLLMNLLSKLDSIPLITLVGGRPSINNITDNKTVVRLALEPLDDSSMRQVFSTFMPRLIDPPSELVDATLSRASGNPGSLHELSALLMESGVVDTTTDPWTADVSKLVMADIPVSLMDALKARVAQLDLRDRLVLQYAAIVGEVFWDEAVVALSRRRTKLKTNIEAAQIWGDDSDGMAIASSLDRLVERQFIVQLPDMDINNCVKYAFARTGIRAQVLEGLAIDELRKAHFLAAEWLYHATYGTGRSFYEEEAAHWEQAGERHRATVALFRAARYARSRFLNQKAIKLFKKGFELAQTHDRLTIINARHDMGTVLEALGDFDEAEKCFTEMLRDAWIVAHRGKAGAALNKIGRLYRARGDGSASRAYLNRALTLFRSAGDVKGVAACLHDLGELSRREGSYERAFNLVNEALVIQRKLANQPSIAVCLHSLGHIESSRAAYSKAEQYLEEALDIRKQSADKSGMAHTLSALAIVLFNRGDLERAISRWEAALSLAEEAGDRRMLAIVHNNLGEVLLEQGKLKTSMQHFEACKEIVTTVSERLLYSEVERNMGVLAQKRGDLESAKKHLSNSLTIAKEIAAKEMEGLAYRGLGELEATTMWDTSNVDGQDKAEQYFETGLKIFRSIGSEFEVARTLHALGNRLLERGDVDRSRQCLEEAQGIFVRIESKVGDKINRTIQDIMAQPRSVKPVMTASKAGAPARPERKIPTAPPRKKEMAPATPVSEPVVARSVGTNEPFLDMTDDVEFEE